MKESVTEIRPESCRMSINGLAEPTLTTYGKSSSGEDDTSTESMNVAITIFVPFGRERVEQQTCSPCCDLHKGPNNGESWRRQNEDAALMVVPQPEKQLQRRTSYDIYFVVALSSIVYRKAQ
jgi:hypothetical protein